MEHLRHVAYQYIDQPLGLRHDANGVLGTLDGARLDGEGRLEPIPVYEMFRDMEELEQGG
jgi:hypothetical protein